MPKLRKPIAVVAAIATIIANYPSSPAFAQTRVGSANTRATAPVDQATLIPSTINAFPKGGEPLKQAISDLVIKNPDLAAALATYLRTEPLTSEQKDAIVAGLSDGLNRLGILAQVGPDLNPLLLALIAGGIGAGVWALTRINNNNNRSVSPN